MRETSITREEIKDFLFKKPGYLKEGAKRLRNHLYKKGFVSSVKTCKLALQEARAESKELEDKINNDEAKILIYDIETSPNIGWFWRAGYKQSIGTHQILKERAVICVSYKWHGEKQVYNLAWDNNQDDKFLIDQFIDVLNEADLIVAHNGDRFDLKWLKTRALIHGLHKKMLPNYKQFDTLKVAKSKLYLNSNRLDYIAKVLGHEGKNDMRPEDWHNVVILKDKKALQKMLDYCDEDVRQLEKVYDDFKYLDNPRLHAGVLQGKTKQTSPITGSVNIEMVKKVTTNRGTVKYVMKDLDTDRLFEMSESNYNKYMEINN